MDKVYQSKKDCCGCGMCMTVCPKHAIQMHRDEMGFVYPEIMQDVCVNCGACQKICSFSKRKEQRIDKGTLDCYAACNINKEELSKSTSGGAFSAISHTFLENGGAVVGACMKLDTGKVHVYHTVIEEQDELAELQGSKYVQSNLLECIDTMDKILRNGKNVLFSGTPCQVDAVKRRFGNYIETQLYTIDIICHGVPNQKFLCDFLNEYQIKDKKELKKIVFRDKEYGWGLNGKLITVDDKIIKFTKNEFSYYKYFLDGETYRESCYACPYACMERVGDITIGDYWGVKKYDPQLLVENGGSFDFKQGISCVIVNNVRGKELLKNFGANIQKAPIELQHVLQINKQLREPAKHTDLRNKIFSLYTRKGYSGVERLFERQKIYRSIKNKIKAIIKK